MNKLGVIVPYRDREEHLAEFVPKIEKYLTNQGIEFVIIIVEQDHNLPFNRGALCNIGYKEARKHRCNYIVFHDVDMIPIDVDYSYSNHPVHLISDDLPFDWYFGGITIFPMNDFLKVNGFSNRYWGWGFEDDDLLVRCGKKSIELVTKEIMRPKFGNNTVVLNGINSFVKINNTINFRKDFSIETKISLGRFELNSELESDRFPIFNIRGYDMELVYNSFKRLSLKFFDVRGKFYEIYTEPTNQKDFEIVIEYKHREKLMSLHVNGKEVGALTLDTYIMNYSNEKLIFLGVNNSLTEFFSGVIRNFNIKVENKSITSLQCDKVKDYKLIDLSENNNHGVLFNTSIKNPNFNKRVVIHSPHRRKSNIHRLSHTDNGFTGGRWKSDLTRWNQIKFFNETLTGYHNPSEDGINSIKYRCNFRDKVENSKCIKINVELKE